MISFLNNFINRKNIHLDFAATTPVDNAVYKEMKKYFSEEFFNPSSNYKDAVFVSKKIKKYRSVCARFFQVKDHEVIFTQGGTESINLAILGLARFTLMHSSFVPHMIFSSIEHPAVKECIPTLRSLGVDIDIVSVNKNGIVNVQELEKKITPRTILISIIFVSNETGTIEPIHKISSIVKKFKNSQNRTQNEYPFIHSDVSQAILTCDVSLSKLGVDMLSVDASKMYGPKMSGLLIKKQHVVLEPLVYGGGQERGLRSGTEHTASIAGTATALFCVIKNKSRDTKHFSRLRTIFIQKLNESIIPYRINGDIQKTVPHILNICIPNLNSDYAIIQLDELGINCSAMTACQGAKGIPKSEVIEALGKPECSQSSLRFSFGRTTTTSDIHKAVLALCEVCQKQKVV